MEFLKSFYMDVSLLTLADMLIILHVHIFAFGYIYNHFVDLSISSKS